MLAGEPPAAIRFPPLKFPRASVRRTSARCGSGSGAPGGGLSGKHQPLRRPLRGFPPVALWYGVASGQSPTEPIQRRRRRCLPTAAGHPQYAVKPGATGFGRVDDHYDRSLARRGACKPVQKATITRSLQDMVHLIGPGSPVAALSGFFLCLSLSSRRSCGQMEGVGRQNWARGRIPIFRKIHLYGKSAKSTHGHTRKKPTQLFPSDLAFFRLPRLP